MRCAKCWRFAKVVERKAVPIGEGYGATFSPHVTVSCPTHGEGLAANDGWSWEDVFGDWSPDA